MRRNKMSSFEAGYEVEWGDCDEAGIVFYPNYFYWLDSTFQKFLRARELGQRQLMAQYGAVTPLVDVGLKFRSPVRYDQAIRILAEIDEWGERKFRISYRIFNAETLVAEGHEQRAWAIMVDGILKGAAIPEDFRRRME
jgi:YbgC/YbaW family acyl-CoA thioester hydrolase